MNTSSLLNISTRLFALTSVASLVIFGTSSSFAAAGSSSSSAAVIVPIEIVKSEDLAFGKFAPGAGGTVTVSTSGVRTASGPILSSIGSSPAAGEFDVSGDNDATYGITWSGATVLTDSESAETMALTKVSALSADGGVTGEVSTGTLSGTGVQTIFLGGVLTVGSSQADGDYTGEVTATVEYN